MKAALTTLVVFFASTSLASTSANAEPAGADRYREHIAGLSRQHNVPERLIHRVIMRESRYNARALHAGNYGLMQIKPATARSMGYRGAPAGLLDGRTNLAYAVPYLANAYRVAGGDENRAVRLYASGFYYEAKRKGMTGRMARAQVAEPEKTVVAQEATPAPQPASPFEALASVFNPQPVVQPVAEPDVATPPVSEAPAKPQKKRRR